jgi:hypothetical protein
LELIQPIALFFSKMATWRPGHIWSLIGQKFSRNAVFCPCRSALVGPDHQSAKKVLILTMKLWQMKKSMNLVEKNVGTPAILVRTLEM